MHKPRGNVPHKPIILDGRTLEGGGQLLRNAICLSAMTGVSVQVVHIRGNRSNGGGLKAQHLACVKWLAHACSAQVQGAEKGSETLLFEPGKADKTVKHLGHSPAFRKVVRDGEPVYECRLDIETAGSTGLALQAILPFILFSEMPSGIPIRLTLTGGTNVSGSPSFEYISQVLLPTLHSIGFPEITARLSRRGWSQGGNSVGSFTLDIPTRKCVVLPAFFLQSASPEPTEKTKPIHLRATLLAPQSCHQHFSKVAVPTIQQAFGETYSSESGNLEIVFESSLHDKRLYLIIVATTSFDTTEKGSQTYKLGCDWLYNRKINSPDKAVSEMVKQVVNDLVNEVESGAYVDKHMRDQLIIFQTLAQGSSEVYHGIDKNGYLRSASLHSQTAAWVASEMLGVRFRSRGSCEGIAFGAQAEDSPTRIGGQADLAQQLEEVSIG